MKTTLCDANAAARKKLPEHTGDAARAAGIELTVEDGAIFVGL